MESLLYMLLSLVFTVYMYASMWRIYAKAGEPGWTAIIPVYSIIILLKIVNKPWWWFFLLLIPVANIVFAIILTHRLSKAFGNGVGFTLGLIFLPFIFIPLLGFGDYSFKLIDNGELTIDNEERKK